MTRRRPRLQPCPNCGGRPEFDTGFSDAPFPPGEEYIGCPWVRSIGGVQETCATSAIGAAAWNALKPGEGRT